MNLLSKAISVFGSDYYGPFEGEIRYNCPFCEKRRGKKDDDYKLYVHIGSENRKKSGKYFCFKCHAKGRLVREYSSDDVYSSIVNLYKDNSNTEDDENDNTFYVPNIEIPKDSLAHEYLAKRGINDDLIDYYNMKLGIDGLFGRIVIPNIMYSPIWTDMYSSRSYINQIPKYKNPAGVKKTQSVFNLHRIKEGGVCYVNEGVITAICAGKDACATYGSSPSDEQIAMIVNKHFDRIYCTYDNDESGLKGSVELSEKLASRVDKSTEVYVVTMPPGVDAADIGEKEYKKYVHDHAYPYRSEVYSKLINLFT